jgi:RNA polymerase sigma-70 factor (ECF subfamily)
MEICLQMEFDSFYLENYERTYRAMILTFRDPPLAEDITQEAFYRALRRWKKVSRLDRPDAWVMVVALNRGRDFQRRRRSGNAKAHLLAVEQTTKADETLIDDRTAVSELLLSVSQRQREALVLRYIVQLTVPEIAVAMGCAEGTVKSTLHTAVTNAAKGTKGWTHVSDR